MSRRYPSVIERYFTPRYKTDLNKIPGADVCILTHTNRISLITLAPSHPILKLGKEVIKVDFQVDKNTNRLHNKVTGKGKRGAQSISVNAALCHVSCSDQSLYTIYAGMKGNLVEVNENLVSEPGLLTSKPQGEGYIAILLTHLQDHGTVISKLLTQEKYEEVLQKRQAATCVITSQPVGVPSSGVQQSGGATCPQWTPYQPTSESVTNGSTQGYFHGDGGTACSTGASCLGQCHASELLPITADKVASDCPAKDTAILLTADTGTSVEPAVVTSTHKGASDCPAKDTSMAVTTDSGTLVTSTEPQEGLCDMDQT